MSCWFPSLLPIFYIIGWLMGHMCSCSLCSWACSLKLSQFQPSPAAYPEDPRLLGIPRYSGSAFSLGSLVIFSLKGRAEHLFFLCFVRPKACPFMGLGPFLLTFNEFGPYPFLESPNSS